MICDYSLFTSPGNINPLHGVLDITSVKIYFFTILIEDLMLKSRNYSVYKPFNKHFRLL